MISRHATLAGERAAIPVGWMVLGLSAASWGLLILAVRIGQAVIGLIGGAL